MSNVFSVRAQRLIHVLFVVVVGLYPWKGQAEQNTTGLGDKTFRIQSEGSGVGILHTGSDGTAFLWFPGQSGLIVGTWDGRELGLSRDVQSRQQSFQLICLNYPSPQRATIGKDTFKTTECFRSDQFSSHVLEFRDGDFLNLGSGKVPCRLCRGDKTLAQLRDMVAN